MYIVYNLILVILLILTFPAWLLLLLFGKKFRAGFWQKAGFFSSDLKQVLLGLPQSPVWFHAVSVGETIAVAGLVKEFSVNKPDIPVVFSTVTLTGQQIAKKRLGDIATIIYFPFDIGFITKKILDIVSPRLVVIVETEIWPNFAYNVFAKNVPMILINGRLSPKSFANYKRFKFFTAKILQCFSCFLMQSDIDLKRIHEIGADSSKVKNVGNLKYDIKTELSADDVLKLRQELNLTLQDKVLIAGSTHDNEEEILLTTYLKLKEKVTELKLILVPRHPERYSDVMTLLEANKINYGKRTLNNTFKDADVFLLDTMGELSNFYSIADIAFIGGSMIQKGGHNPLEPAAYLVPVVIGPHTFNFVDITGYMVQSGAAFQVDDKDGLFSILLALLESSETFNKAQSACLKVFEENSGATQITLETIYSYLND